MLQAIEYMKDNNYILNVNDIEQNQVRGVLRIIPKKSLKDFSIFRPLFILYKRYALNTYISLNCTLILRQFTTKQCMHKIYTYARSLSKVSTFSLFEAWKSYLEIVGDSQIYAAKVDISDAYGNVNVGSCRSYTTLQECYQYFLLTPIQIFSIITNCIN